MNKFWILWNPASTLPPTRIFTTRENAEQVATAMAQRFPGQKFYACHVRSVAQVVPQPSILTNLE